MELLEWNVQHAMSNKKYAMFSERWAARLVHEHANATSNMQVMLSLFLYAQPTYTLYIQLLEYVIPTAAAAAAAAPAAAAPPKSPLCYGVSHVMVLAMLWC